MREEWLKILKDKEAGDYQKLANHIKLKDKENTKKLEDKLLGVALLNFPDNEMGKKKHEQLCTDLVEMSEMEDLAEEFNEQVSVRIAILGLVANERGWNTDEDHGSKEAEQEKEKEKEKEKEESQLYENYKITSTEALMSAIVYFHLCYEMNISRDGLIAFRLSVVQNPKFLNRIQSLLEKRMDITDVTATRMQGHSYSYINLRFPEESECVDSRNYYCLLQTKEYIESLIPKKYKHKINFESIDFGKFLPPLLVQKDHAEAKKAIDSTRSALISFLSPDPISIIVDYFSIFSKDKIDKQAIEVVETSKLHDPVVAP